MTETYTLDNLEIDEISLVDRGANPHASVMLMKRDDVSIDKRLEALTTDKAQLIAKMQLQELQLTAEELWPHLGGTPLQKAHVLQAVQKMDDTVQADIMAFFKAADAALAARLTEQGQIGMSDENDDDSTKLDRLARDYAAEHKIPLQMAKKKLIERNGEAATLFRKIIK